MFFESPNSFLPAGIILNKSKRQPYYTLYFHIALCDLVNGIIGIITAGFLLRVCVIFNSVGISVCTTMVLQLVVPWWHIQYKLYSDI